MSRKDTFIIDAVRTPIGNFGGTLSKIRVDDLAAHVIKTLISRYDFDAEQIDDVIIGCANQAGEDNRQLWKDKRTKIYKDEGQGLMAIDGKINGYGEKHPKSGNRRVQCSFKISEAIKAGIPYKLYTDVYRDICLPYIQESASRTFN